MEPPLIALLTLLSRLALAEPYAEALARYAPKGEVDYAGLRQSGLLQGPVDALAAAPLPADKAGQMAFWINAYNLLTLDLVADHWPLASIRDLDGGDPWSKRRFMVAGRSLSLNDIEHKILRPMGDPRIHAAINCASRGCPPLPATPFTAAGLDAQLDAATRAWVQGGGVKVDATAKVVSLSMIFDWFGEDFLPTPGEGPPGQSGKKAAALRFALPYLRPAEAEVVRAGGYTVRYAPYDWAVNSRR